MLDFLSNSSTIFSNSSIKEVIFLICCVASSIYFEEEVGRGGREGFKKRKRGRNKRERVKVLSKMKRKKE